MIKGGNRNQTARVALERFKAIRRADALHRVRLKPEEAEQHNREQDSKESLVKHDLTGSSSGTTEFHSNSGG